MKRDPEAVKKFLSTSKTGFSAKAKVAADTLAGTKNGSLLKSTETLQAKIELNAGRISSLEVRLTRERTRLLTAVLQHGNCHLEDSDESDRHQQRCVTCKLDQFVIEFVESSSTPSVIYDAR